jgi:putative aldouronate transport system permease protein
MKSTPASIERLNQKSFRRYRYLYVMFIPVLAWYLIFCYVPMYGLVMAFQDFFMSKGYFGSRFVGFKHFLELYNDPDFVRAFVNTAVIALLRMVTEFPFGIALALFLNEIRHQKLRKTVQTIIYLPHFLSWVIVASIFFTFLSPERGLPQMIYASFGKDAPNYLTNPESFRALLILSDIWKEAGFSTVVYVAAMAAIDPQQYEAALIDGAGRWGQMMHITLPGISNIVVVMFILTIGQILNWGFDQVYNFYSPMVFSSGDIVDTYIFRSALGDNKFSFAAAAGLFKSLLCAVFLVASNAAVKKLGQESIY